MTGQENCLTLQEVYNNNNSNVLRKRFISNIKKSKIYASKIIEYHCPWGSLSFIGISSSSITEVNFILTVQTPDTERSNTDLNINPIKARGFESMYRRGGLPRPPPPKKALENMHMAEIHVHSPIFQGQLIEKIRSITCII